MTFEERTQNFEKWMQEQNIKINPNIGLHDYRAQHQGRGMIAHEPVKEGEILFTIPNDALITETTVPEIAKLIEDLGDWPKLICTMMYVAAKGWKPYFDVLPTTFNTPMFWEKELEMLKPSTVVEKIGRQEAEEMYASLKPVLDSPEFKDVDTSLEVFHRMGSLIMAYGFDLLGQDDTVQKAMAPPADMLNSHSKLCNAHLEMPDEVGGPLEMVAVKDIAKGEQIYNYYGDLPNSDLLRRYGYVEAGTNQSDIAEISLEYLLEAANLEQNILDKWCKYDEYEIIDEAFDVGYEGVPHPDLVAVANMLSEIPSRTAYEKCTQMAEDEEISPKARDILVEAVQKRLQEYPVPATLPAAEQQVYVDTPSMCAQILNSEQEILRMCLGWLGVNKKAKTA